MASGRSSLRSAQSLLPRSAAKVTVETIARKRKDGRAVDVGSAEPDAVGSPMGGPGAIGAGGSESGSDEVLSMSVIREGKYGLRHLAPLSQNSREVSRTCLDTEYLFSIGVCLLPLGKSPPVSMPLSRAGCALGT